MVINKIDSMVAGDLTNTMDDFEVDSVTTDGVSDQKETEWMMKNWSIYLGYYESIPELTATIDAKATWTIGKGFNADPETTAILKGIKGWGVDTFNTVLENMMVTYLIGGDAFAEIIKDDDGIIINLKPLDPSIIRVITNRKGAIIRYEQTSKVKKPDIKFQPEDMFHISRNRIADNVHGTSIVKKLQTIIDMRNEAMTDYKKVMHRYIQPQWKFKLKTDVPSEIAAYKSKMDGATGAGENIYEPFDVSESELLAVAPNSTLSPLAWIENLNKYFYQAAAIPQFIVGGGTGFTEASEKIAYLAFQQTIAADQLYLEEEILSQLNLVIELEPIASLENELISDNEKDGAVNIQPNETTAGSGQ